VFYNQLLVAFVAPLLAVINSIGLLNVQLFSRVARTQAAADALLAPPAFPAAVRLAQTISSVNLAIMYAPVLPILPAIAALGVLCAYAADLWVALRQSSKLHAFGMKAVVAVGLILRVLPLVQIVLIYTLYFREYNQLKGDEDTWPVQPSDLPRGSPSQHNDGPLTVPFAIGAVIWCVAALLPCSWLVSGRKKAGELKAEASEARPATCAAFPCNLSMS
jgi:hypothetical protein